MYSMMIIIDHCFPANLVLQQSCFNTHVKMHVCLCVYVYAHACVCLCVSLQEHIGTHACIKLYVKS